MYNLSLPALNENKVSGRFSFITWISGGGEGRVPKKMREEEVMMKDGMKTEMNYRRLLGPLLMYIRVGDEERGARWVVFIE